MLFDLDFCSVSCGILSLSAASSTFRSLFVEVYVTGVYWRIRPHGQAANDVDMERVPLVQPNHSQNTLVKASQAVVNTKSFVVAGLCFSSRGELRGKFLNPRRHANTCGLPREPNPTTTLLGLNSHGYHTARFPDMVI